MSKNLKYIALIIIGLFLFEICNDKKSNRSDSIEPIITKPKEKILNPTERPLNGFSPYDNYYGRGIYNNSTNNVIYVTSPPYHDIVILIKDVYSGRMIRNEYIRSNSTFSLTGVPYGTFKFYYTFGKDWSKDADFKNGIAKGNFLKESGVSKSDKSYDIFFEQGYESSYTLKLQLTTGGNLSTISSSEDEL